jgi:hypothetical protein
MHVIYFGSLLTIFWEDNDNFTIGNYGTVNVKFQYESVFDDEYIAFPFSQVFSLIHQWKVNCDEHRNISNIEHNDTSIN